MSEQDSKRATLSVKKRTVATPSARDEKPRLRAGARGRQVAQLKLAKDKTKRSAPPTAEVSAPRAETFAPTYTAAPPKTRSPRSSGPKALPQVGHQRAPEEKIFIPQVDVFVPQGNGVETFHIFAPCPMGLEEALAAELSALGYDGVSATRAGCHFVADWWGVQRANLYSRLATRILVRVGEAPVQREDDILELARSIAWERWFGAEHTLRVDTSAVKSPMQSLQ
ncbi:MAG: THUMP domain-containing protein, partial [Burkholderiales bacterium]|nr:THUMP domain-containing protein [Burkholderiales bacterium]